MKVNRNLISRTYYKNGSQTFNPSATFQTFTVPTGVTKINADCVSSKGADNSGILGGKGGRVQCTFPVTGGDSLYIYVGDIPSTANTAEYNASDVRTNNTGITDSTSLNSRILVAGGGGSAGGTYVGGDGGDLIGGSSTGSYPSTGGTQSSGGTGYNSGSLGLGGNGASPIGGAGGAGYYGGGGGRINTGGGGGSSYTNSDCYKIHHTQGYNNGSGYIVFTYAIPSTSDDYDFYEDEYEYKLVKEEESGSPDKFYAFKSFEKGEYYGS